MIKDQPQHQSYQLLKLLLRPKVRTPIYRPFHPLHFDGPCLFQVTIGGTTTPAGTRSRPNPPPPRVADGTFRLEPVRIYTLFIAGYSIVDGAQATGRASGSCMYPTNDQGRHVQCTWDLARAVLPYTMVVVMAYKFCRWLT